mmetsp:Transcript_33719/g.70106  ORF Transcript_33719/g.70106 Transcript_33719/m.70106 type:complete len:307 (-) Transcript_33719:373-1293(-)
MKVQIANVREHSNLVGQALKVVLVQVDFHYSVDFSSIFFGDKFTDNTVPGTFIFSIRPSCLFIPIVPRGEPETGQESISLLDSELIGGVFRVKFEGIFEAQPVDRKGSGTVRVIKSFLIQTESLEVLSHLGSAGIAFRRSRSVHGSAGGLFIRSPRGGGRASTTSISGSTGRITVLEQVSGHSNYEQENAHTETTAQSSANAHVSLLSRLVLVLFHHHAFHDSGRRNLKRLVFFKVHILIIFHHCFITIIILFVQIMRLFFRWVFGSLASLTFHISVVVSKLTTVLIVELVAISIDAGGDRFVVIL